VLRAYGKSAEKKLSELSIHLGLDSEDESEHAHAISFIEYIEDLNKKLHTPKSIEKLRMADIPEIAKKAEKESNPTYPVPVIWKRKDYEAVLHKLYALRKDMRQRA
jgi:Alcohol dehydrogenase, class IV